MFKLFITQQSHDVISDALGISRMTIEPYEIVVYDSVSILDQKGAKLSEETKEKIRQKAIGRKGSKGQREWLIRYNKERALKKLNQAHSQL